MFVGFPNQSPLLTMFYRSHQSRFCLVTQSSFPWGALRDETKRALTQETKVTQGPSKLLSLLWPEIRLYFCFAKKAKFRQESATTYKFENIEDLPGRSQVISLPITNPRVKSLYMTSIYLHQDTPRGRKKKVFIITVFRELFSSVMQVKGVGGNDLFLCWIIILIRLIFMLTWYFIVTVDTRKYASCC